MYRPDSIIGSAERLEACVRGETHEPVPPFTETTRILNGCLQVVVSFADTDEGQDAVSDFLAGCRQVPSGQLPVKLRQPTTSSDVKDLIPEDFTAYAVFAYGVDNPTAAHIINLGIEYREQLPPEAPDEIHQEAEIIHLPVQPVAHFEVSGFGVVAGAAAGH